MQTITAICSNYTLENILSIEPNNEEKQTLLKLVISTIYPPPLADINNTSTVTTIQCNFRSPSATVLFDVISEKLLSLLRASCSSNSPTIDLIRPAFFALVRKDPIFAAVKFINSHPSLTFSFKQDFINRTLQLPLIQGKWLDLAIVFLESFKFGSDILELYLLLYKHGNLLSSLGVMLHPMINLKDPTILIEGLRKDFTQLRFNPREIGKIKKNIVENSISTLYQYLMTCTQTGSDIENWVHIFHQFHMQHPHHNALIGILQPHFLLFLDIMTIVFFYFSAAELHAIQQLHALITKASCEEAQTVLGLNHFIPLISGLFSFMRYFY